MAHANGDRLTTAAAENLQTSGQGGRPRFRLARAYWVTVRVLASYAWLRLWRPVIGPDAYARRLVEKHRHNARRVERTILELDGLFIKIGQLISILTNFLPEEFRKELEALQDSIPPRPLHEIVSRVRSELGRSPDELFAWFNPEPMASASLAQVHEARLHDGRRVAVKVQHADIDEIARLDLRAIRRILAVVQFFTRIRGLEAYHTEISEMIHEELDFLLEAQHIVLIASHFAGDPMVGFPVIVPELSTRRVLTTEYVQGTKVTDVDELEALDVDRVALADRILRAYCQMIFVDGVYHADPHPGNILVKPDGSIVFVDFGAVGVLSSEMKEGIPMFLEGVIRRDAARITGALRKMRFVAYDHDRRDRPDVAERVIEYFQEHFLEQLTAESWSLSQVQADVGTKLEAMADLRRLDISFRQLTATFQVPRDWVLLERTLLLLLGLCTYLDPGMNPMRTVQPYLERFVLGEERNWLAMLRVAAKETMLSTLALPQDFRRFLGLASRGDIEIRIRDLRESANLIYASSHQIVWVVLATGSGVVSYLARLNGDRAIAIATGAVSVLLLLGLGRSLLAARRWRE